MKLHLEIVSGSNLITFKGFDCQVSPQKTRNFDIRKFVLHALCKPVKL